MKVFLAYAADAYLSYGSRDLLGVYSTFENALECIKGKTELTDDDLWNLENVNQTQCRTDKDGHPVEENFMIESVEVDSDL